VGGRYPPREDIIMAQHHLLCEPEPTCEICKLLLPSARGQKLTKAPEICADFDRVVTFPQLHRGRIPGTHAVALASVLMVYELRNNVKCHRGHLHMHGVIGETLCGFVVLVGNRCAYDTIANWAEVDSEIRRVRTYDANLATMRDAGDVIVRTRSTIKRVESYQTTSRRLKDERFHDIGSKLLDVDNVVVDRRGEFRGRLRGLEILTPPSTIEAGVQVHEVEDLLRAHPSPDDGMAIKIVDRIKRLGTAEAALRHWADVAATSFDPRNLALAIVAARLENHLEADGDELVGKAWRLGLTTLRSRRG
jgi:hypothetical protein